MNYLPNELELTLNPNDESDTYLLKPKTEFKIILNIGSVKVRYHLYEFKSDKKNKFSDYSNPKEFIPTVIKTKEYESISFENDFDDIGIASFKIVFL